jgi:glucosyl-dolichyl phosphate glucuronosyltransferase
MHASPNPEPCLDPPPVSLIVTTYTEDRLNNVTHLLESVRAQTLPAIEVVFVGEGTPRLCDQVKRSGSRLAPCRLETVFNPGRPGLSQARNIGIMHARGRILAFVDDDVVLFPDWAEKLVNAFAEDQSIIGVSGAALPLWEDSAMAWLPEEFYWLVSCTGWFDGDRGSPLRNAWGMNMAFRREVFAHASFDEQLGGNKGARDGSKLGLLAEDAVFSFRVREAMGGRIVFNPEVRVYHKVSRYRLTPRYVRRRAFWEGYTKAVLGREYARNTRGRGGLEWRLVKRIVLRFLPQTVGQLVRWPFLSARRLAFAIGTLFYLALGYTSARFTVLGVFTRPRFER